MQVKDHKNYACFNYKSGSCDLLALGDVVIKDGEVYNETTGNDDPAVGVIIQVHESEEYRTDMFGNCNFSEIRVATLPEIEKYRPDIVPDLKYNFRL